MTTDNTCDKFVFLLRQALWIVLTWIAYRTYVFRILPGFTQLGSIGILLGCVLGFSLLGTLFELKNHRNDLSIAINLGLGYGLYYGMTSWTLQADRILLSLVIAGLVALILAVPILFRKIKKRKKKGREIGRRILKVFYVSCVCFAMAFACNIVVDGASRAFYQAKTRVQAGTMPSNQMRDQLIAQNIELLSRIHNTKWHKYTQGERIKALQAVADIEQAYLGLSGQLTIVPDTLNMGGTMAYYSPEDNTITVDKNAIMSVLAAESLKVICHEAYHGYEYALINALQTVDDSASTLKPFRDAARYEYEFSSYTSQSENKELYEQQACEMDAAQYAETEAAVYQKAIKKHLGIKY